MRVTNDAPDPASAGEDRSGARRVYRTVLAVIAAVSVTAFLITLAVVLLGGDGSPGPGSETTAERIANGGQSTTAPPVTEPPATQPPATRPPATQPPATQPPATQPPVTQPPATEPPATEPAFPDGYTHEEQLEAIRSWYYDCVENMDRYTCIEYDPQYFAYWNGGELVAIVFRSAVGPDGSYVKSRYYHNGELYFQYLEGANGDDRRIRLYFWKGELIRWMETDRVVHEEYDDFYSSEYEYSMDEYREAVRWH